MSACPVCLPPEGEACICCPRCGVPPALDGRCLCAYPCDRCQRRFGSVTGEVWIVPGEGQVCDGCLTDSDDAVSAREWCRQDALRVRYGAALDSGGTRVVDPEALVFDAARFVVALEWIAD